MPIARPAPNPTRGPDWWRLLEQAHAQGGYFTAKDAQMCRISSPLLRQNVQSGAVEWIQRGIYRLTTFPPHTQSDLLVLWLWSDRQGVFSHETALSLNELSDVLPNVVVMTVPPSWAKRRVKLPDGVELHPAVLPESDVMWVDAVPVTHPLRTVIDCERVGVSPEFVHVAVNQGIARGWFSRAQYQKRRRRELAPAPGHTR